MKWLHFILSHSIFISICAVALTFQTQQLLQLNNDPFMYGFIFFATVCSYNFYWILSKIAFAENRSISRILKKESTGIYLLLFSLFGLLYCLLRSGLHLHIVFTAFGLTVIYVIPLLPFKHLRFTRRAGVVKTVLLAFTWAFVTAYMPIQKSVAELDNAGIYVITYRFLFMLMLCIIFDNRDKAMDKIRGLHSLATDLKPAVLKILIYLIFATLFISDFFYRDYAISFYQSIALQISTLALLAVYFMALKNRHYLFYYFIVDGLMLFSAIATFVASI